MKAKEEEASKEVKVLPVRVVFDSYRNANVLVDSKDIHWLASVPLGENPASNKLLHRLAFLWNEQKTAPADEIPEAMVFKTEAELKAEATEAERVRRLSLPKAEREQLEKADREREAAAKKAKEEEIERRKHLPKEERERLEAEDKEREKAEKEAEKEDADADETKERKTAAPAPGGKHFFGTQRKDD